MNKQNHGSPEIWLRAGINHHMTVVSRQIANPGGGAGGLRLMGYMTPDKLPVGYPTTPPTF